MVNAVIFDWDGTLANTKKAVLYSFQEVLRKSGCVVPNEAIEKWIGVGTKKTFEKVLEDCNIKFDELMLEKLSNEKISIQLGLTNTVTLFDGVKDLLEELYGKIKIALATMSSKKVVNKLLSEKGIKNYFDVILSVDDVDSPKPDPEVFLVSAKKLGVTPKDCVVVEDSVFGVQAAKVAGMKCIAVSSGAYNSEELQKEKADLVISSLKEKDKILGFIFGSEKPIH